jgi:hypothetical protein
MRVAAPLVLLRRAIDADFPYVDIDTTDLDATETTQ